MKKVICVLLTVSTAVLLFSCSMLIRQNNSTPTNKKTKTEAKADENKTKDAAGSSISGGKNGELTPEQLAKMSPEDLRRYQEERQKKEKAKAFSDGFGKEKMTEEERKRARLNVSRQLTPEERGSAFPWGGSYTRRSETLHDSESRSLFKP